MLTVHYNFCRSPPLRGIPVDYENTLDRWYSLVHPDERQEMLDYLKEVVDEKKPFDREYRIVRHGDKQVRWVHGRGRLQFNEDGQPISILGTVQDITERKVMLVRADLLGQFANRIAPLMCFGYRILQHVSPVKPDGEEIEGQAIDGCVKHGLAFRQFFFGQLAFGDVLIPGPQMNNWVCPSVVKLQGGAYAHAPTGLAVSVVDDSVFKTLDTGFFSLRFFDGSSLSFLGGHRDGDEVAHLVDRSFQSQPGTRKNLGSPLGTQKLQYARW